MKLSVTLILFGVSHCLFSQFSPPPNQISVENKTEKKMTKREYKKTFRYQFYKHHEDLITEYHKRMKQNRRKYKRIARIMKRPQYSDPTYFGHRRKPKIRSVDKMKFCKECEIKH